MRIFLTDEEVLELVPDVFDHFPDSDFTHRYAERMDMVYNKEMDMYEDVNELSIDKLKRDAIKYSRDLNDLPQPSDYTNNKITLEEDLP